MNLNPCKEKKLTNFRVSGHEENFRILEPYQFSIEEALTFIQEEEFIEVSLDGVRVRKKILDIKKRKRDRLEKSKR